MSKLATITRRTFLVGSAVIAGGVAFGYYQYRKPVANPLLKKLGKGQASITPYVLIDQQGITLITPRADVGQGVYHLQAALIAEELDVDLSQVSINPGPPSKAYYNATVAAEGFPVASTAEGTMPDLARNVAKLISKMMGLQITGGSSSASDAYQKLRQAGAVARETLKLAAAKQKGVDVSSLSTKNGAVIFADGSSIAYTELATKAAEIEAVNDVELRSPEQWRYITKPMQRLDIVAKSTGTQQYGIDLQMDDLLYATVRTNPGIGAPMVSYDDSAASSMRGVQSIVPITNGLAVVADNTWRAIKAANAIKFTWAKPNYPATTEQIFKEIENSFADEFKDSELKDDGSVEDSFKLNPVIQAEYRVPYLAHAPLEPMTAVAQFKDDGVHIWTGTQIPRFLQKVIAPIAEVEPEQVHIHALYSGGSFGRRLEPDYAVQAVEIAKTLNGKPVKLTWSREEDMTHDFPRPAEIARGRGVVKNGQIDALQLKVAASSSSASAMSRLGESMPGPDVAIVAGAWDQPYAIPNYQVQGYRAPELVPTSSWRSVGASANGFFHESFLDELIRAAGKDTMAERIRLCNHPRSKAVLEKIAKLSNWQAPLAENQGRGVAFTVSFGVPTAEVVEVTNTDQGIRIDKVYMVAAVGRVLDPVNFENQAAGGVIWGLGHAINSEISYQDHHAQQTNFHNFLSMRMKQCPEVVIDTVEDNGEIKGIGEPPVPPAAPALANAIFDATGQRIRELPLSKQIRFI